MQLGNSIKFSTDIDKSKNLFIINTIASFIDCVSVLAHHARNKKRCHVQIVSSDKFKMAETRKAYFAWINEIRSSAEGTGESVQKMHTEFKASYLVPILCRENQEFADLVLRETQEGKLSDIVITLLSVADGSITTHKIMSEYFDYCKYEWNNRFEKI